MPAQVRKNKRKPNSAKRNDVRYKKVNKQPRKNFKETRTNPHA